MSATSEPKPARGADRTPAIPVVIDTDIGTDVDDALALTLALASPELDVIGITIVDGDVDTRARIAARLLGMAGRPDIPVFKGARSAIGVGRMPLWFGHEGRGILDRSWDGPEAQIHPTAAHEWLVERSCETDYHLVAIGPFTNVAHAVRLDPGFAGRLRHLSVMGGMVHPEAYLGQWQQFFSETGLPPNHMDHNTASDVEAALVVARAGFTMTWVTAELTFGTTLARSVMDRLAGSSVPLGESLAAMLRIWSDEWFHVIPNFPVTARPFPEDAVAALHDPLAVASVFGGAWLSTRAHQLRFGQVDELFLIQETTDSSEATQDVSTAVDHRAFADFVARRIEAFLAPLEGTRGDLWTR